MAQPRRPRMAELRRRWRSAEQRVWFAAPGSPEWDAARAESDEAESIYMARLNRILDRARRHEERAEL